MSEKRAKFVRLPTEKLFVDQTGYQRDLKPKNVLRITQGGWNERRAGALQVNERDDGRYAVYDGQHRLEAARALGIAEVPCMVSSGMTVEQEAQAFIDCNRERQQPDWIDYLHALVGAKDPEALAIVATVNRNRLKIGRQRDRNVVMAALALMRTSEVFGLKALDHALAVLKLAWAGEPESLKGQFIQATARVLTDYAEVIDADRLAQVLSRTTPAEVIRLAKSMSASFDLSVEAVARALVTTYNKRLSASRALDFEIVLTRSAAVRRGVLKRGSTNSIKAQGQHRSPAGSSASASEPIAAKAR